MIKEKISSEDKEVENNQERVKKLHKGCRDLLEEFGNTILNPKESYKGSYIITPIKEIDKNLNICLSTDPIAGGTLNREEALNGSLFVYIGRENTKDNSENIRLIELNASGKYQINDFVFKLGKNERPHREEINLNDSRVLENCGRFIARFNILPLKIL